MLKYAADVYDKMLVINEMYFTLIDKLYDNGCITYNQSRELMNITLDQIKDPEFEGYCHCMLYYKSLED